MSPHNLQIKQQQQKKPSSEKANKLEQPSYVSYENIEKTLEPALFYGFTPLTQPHIHTSDFAAAKSISNGEVVVDNDNHAEGATLQLEEKIALLRLYEEEKLARQPQPIMFFYKKPFIGDRKKANPKESHYGLEIIGTNKSVAEAVLLQTSLAILRDAGETDLHVEINSIGDKESLTRFNREITTYYKKFLSDLPAKCRETFKKDVFSLLGCDHESCKKLAHDCPKSINFLSEKSRQHFKEVLEYLEVLEIPYTINNTLVANRDYCSEVIFEIRGPQTTDHPKAISIRYDSLAKRLSHKKEIPAVGVSIAITKKSVKSEILKQSVIKQILNPHICFMQLGFEAKLQSLKLIEHLRLARIPVIQSLTKDKMAGQVGMAEKTSVPVVIIMGKKEAVEGSAIVRETSTRSQDTVPLPLIAARLKKYKV